MKKVINLSIFNGTSKKDNKPFKAIKLDIGQYSTLVFDDPIRIDYVERYINMTDTDSDNEL